MRILPIKATVGVIVVLVLAGCATSGNSESSFLPERHPDFVLSEEQEAQLVLYKSLDAGTLLIDDLQPTPVEVFAIDPYTQSYEGYRVLRLLGLVDQLSLSDQYEFIAAMFRDIPNPATFGVPVRNIVVGQWFDNGEPLIVHVTLAFSGDAPDVNPVVVAAFNTFDGIRRTGHKHMRSEGSASEYPRFVRTDDRWVSAFAEYYTLTVFDHGQVSASGAVGQDLPDFATIEDVRERVNLTDAYLRDGVRENDAEVVPVLESVIVDETVAPLSRVHARMQLFTYYLFSGDLAAAQEVSDALQTWDLISEPTVVETELAEVARIDVPNILAIAAALSTGDTSQL